MDHEPQLAIDRDVPTLSTAEKRGLIDKELRENPQRSDRAIAQAVGHGICHKTVAAARERLGIASPVGPQTSADAITRAAAGEKVSWPAGKPETPADVVGLISTTLAKNGLDPSDPTLFPILTAAANRKEKKFNPFDPDDDCLIAPERLGLAAFVNTRGNVVIANGNERDGIDEMVQVAPSDLPALISRLGEIQSEFRDGGYVTAGED